MRVAEFDVSSRAEDFAVSVLRDLGCRVKGYADFQDVVNSMDLTTSAGFGYSDTAETKLGLLVGWNYGTYEHYMDWYNTLPDGVFSFEECYQVKDPARFNNFPAHFITNLKVKEEVSKLSKIELGDYRTFFCTPFNLVLDSKLEQERLNRCLTASGFMFKGEDARAAIRELYVASKQPGVVAKQGDATLLDRSISRTLLSRCFSVRNRLGAVSSVGVRDATLYPVVHFVDEDGVSKLAKIGMPQLSGRDSTTEDDLLVIFLIVCEFCVRNGIGRRDFYFTGVGDDWHLITTNEKFNDLTPEFFAGFGIKMKLWDVREHFHFLGAEIVETKNGPQPVWDLERSLVRLAYRDKRESDFVYLQRVIGVLSYNVYHPQRHILDEYLKLRWRDAVLQGKERIVLRSMLDDVKNYYVSADSLRVGSKLSYDLMPETKKKASKKQKKQSKKIKKSKAGRSISPKWLDSIMDPWKHEPTGVPDQETQSTLKCVSRYTSLYQTVDTNGTPGVNHGLQIGIGPYASRVISGTGGVANCDAISYRGYDPAIGYTGNVTVVRLPNEDTVFPQTTMGTANTSAQFQYRVTAMAARLSYDGTELQRSGRVMAGLVEPLSKGTNDTIASSPCNPHNACFGYNVGTLPNQSTSDFRGRLRRIATLRNPDGSIEVRWIPSGVPSYAPVPYNGNGLAHYYDMSGPCIFFGIAGDQTASAGAVGNTWMLDVIVHWEILPMSLYSHVIAPTPSPYDPTALAVCLNAFQRLCSVTEVVGGNRLAMSDGEATSVPSVWESFLKGANYASSTVTDVLSSESGKYAARQLLGAVLSKYARGASEYGPQARLRM